MQNLDNYIPDQNWDCLPKPLHTIQILNAKKSDTRLMLTRNAFTTSSDVCVNIGQAIRAMFDLVLLGVNSIILVYKLQYYGIYLDFARSVFGFLLYLKIALVLKLD